MSGTSTLDKDGSVVKTLFLGSILEQNIFPYPAIPKQDRDMLDMLLQSIDKFMQKHQDNFLEYERQGYQPEDFIAEMKELGLFGLLIPEAYGGIALSYQCYAKIIEQICRYDAATALTVAAHNSIGIMSLILFGTDAQKEKYLPKLASGEFISAFALTESMAGSDANFIKTTAKRNEDGTWTLNGEKIWITNGSFADLFTVFAKTDSKSGKISAFLVEKAYDGVICGENEKKLGICASATSSVVLNNVNVPSDSLIGEEGKGFRIAMTILNHGRCGLGAGCIGGMKECLKLATQQAQDRKQFGKSISEFGLIKQKISQMTVACYAAESAVSMLAYYIDSKVADFSLEAAIIKVFASESMWHCANEALQIAGGNGYMREFPYEKWLRDARINPIFEGTNEVLRLFIALSGMKDAGSYLKEIGQGASGIFNDPIKGFGLLSDYAQKRFAQLTSLGRDRIEAIAPELESEAKIYEIYTLRLSKAVDALLRHYKKDILEQQIICERVANVAIDLFIGLTVLARVSAALKSDSDNCKKELTIAKLFTQQAKRRMNHNIRSISINEDDLVHSLSDEMVGNLALQ